MSRDIFVQDLPANISSVEQIPDDFKPRENLVKRSDVVAAVIAEAPDTKTQPDGWLVIDRRGLFYIEVNLETGKDQIGNFAFHISGDCEAEKLVGRILKRLKLRALDGDSPDGLFHTPS